MPISKRSERSEEEEKRKIRKEQRREERKKRQEDEEMEEEEEEEEAARQIKRSSGAQYLQHIQSQQEGAPMEWKTTGKSTYALTRLTTPPNENPCRQQALLLQRKPLALLKARSMSQGWISWISYLAATGETQWT